MSEITAAMVRDLREKTGAGMMDCKRALAETDGDMDAAVDWLRKKGLAAAAKKSGRVAAEGLIGIATSPHVAAMVEVYSETDFVARNEQFQRFVTEVADLVLSVGEDVEALKKATFPGARRVPGAESVPEPFGTVGQQLNHLIATIGENITIRRAKRLRVKSGTVASYVHSAVKPGLGKIGVLVALENGSEVEVLEALGRQIGMHVAAARPEALDINGVDPSALHREKAVLTAQARASGKAENIIEKMVEGRIRKYYEEVVLLEQIWVHDGESRVRKVVESAGARLTGFARFQLGEGIEKPGNDFAADVAAAAGVPPATPPVP